MNLRKEAMMNGGGAMLNKVSITSRKNIKRQTDKKRCQSQKVLLAYKERRFLKILYLID